MSKRAPVSVCLIVRNEAPRLIRCLESLRPHVEEIVVVDTGSSDGTVERLRDPHDGPARAATGEPLVDRLETFYGCNEGGAKDGRIEDFSLARQRSFDLATRPWAFWCDGDDVVEGAENLAEACARHGDGDDPLVVLYPYEYAHDHRGNPTTLHYRERLVRNPRAFEWVGPVHEVLMPRGGAGCRQSTEEAVRIVHRRAGKVEEPGRNLRILEKWIALHGVDKDARMLYYAALEYGQSGKADEAIRYHELYVARSGWDDEKCLSCLELARHRLARSDYEEAARWAFKAAEVCFDWREPWFMLGKIFYQKAKAGGLRRDWDRAVSFFRRGLSLPPTKTHLFVNPMEAAYEVHTFYTYALAQVGELEESLASAETALATVPDDPNLLHNARQTRSLLAKRRLGEDLALLEELGRVREDYGISEEQAHVVRCVLAGSFKRQGSANDPAPEPKSGAGPAPATSPGPRLDVALFLGGAYEEWTPESLERGGMGGSETMAWEMARRLARRGHRVRVYGDCPGQEGVREGVEWLDHRNFLAGDRKSDVLISSRVPELVDYDWQARCKVAWVHDVHLGAGLTNARALKFDRFLCLSRWHRELFLRTYPFVHESSVVVTRNAIDLSRYEGAELRDPHRMIYSSSPDRGLLSLLQCLPKIRERVPDASLHVYYGFDNWEKSADSNQRANAQVIKGMLGAYSVFGAVNHGRVPGKVLAREQMRSGVWAYPTWFWETSCITAMEAQAAGLRIVTSPIAALNETVGVEHGFLVDHTPERDWLSPAYQAEFVDRVVECMLADVQTHPVGQTTGSIDRRMNRERQRARAWASFGFEPLADEWCEMLARFCAEVERDVVPRYRASGE